MNEWWCRRSSGALGRGKGPGRRNSISGKGGKILRMGSHLKGIRKSKLKHRASCPLSDPTDWDQPGRQLPNHLRPALAATARIKSPSCSARCPLTFLDSMFHAALYPTFHGAYYAPVWLWLSALLIVEQSPQDHSSSYFSPFPFFKSFVTIMKYIHNT